MSKGWTGGSTTRWRKLRLLVLSRDAYQCTARLPGICTHDATQVHHIHGKAVTGDDPAYLTSTCAPCNQSIGDPQRAPDPPHRALSAW